MTPAGEFWLQCEGIVQELDDKRQELPMGMLKQLHTRMLFILTRCTRLLQFHKETGLAENEHVLQLRQSRVLHSADKRIQSKFRKDEKVTSASKTFRPASAKKFYSQEQHGLKGYHANQSKSSLSSLSDKTSKQLKSSGQNQIACDKLQPLRGDSHRQVAVAKEENACKGDPLKTLSSVGVIPDVDQNAVRQCEIISSKIAKDSAHSSKHQRKPSWGYWGSHQNIFDEHSIICRICEEDIVTSLVEDHSRICAVADRCDQKGLSVNERLARVAQTLEKMIESSADKNTQYRVGSPDFVKISKSDATQESDDSFPEAGNAVLMDDLKDSFPVSFKAQFFPKSDRGMTTSSAGSTTPRSPLLTPTSSQVDLLLAAEVDDLPQVLFLPFWCLIHFLNLPGI